MQEYVAMSSDHQAVVKKGQSMDNKEIIITISEAGHTDDFENYKSSSLFRVNEIGVKIRTARHEHFVRRHEIFDKSTQNRCN
uniref:Uncharacterized protein n=1 Tax=Arion vulgaris TaxID=1028688 RepID=A0A0B7AAZ9_9EUPU